MRTLKARDPWLLTALALGLVLLGLVVVPQIWIARASLLSADGQSVTASNFARFFTSVRYRGALVTSVLVSVLTTVLALAVAVPLAFVHARYRLPGRRAVLALATMSTASPPFLGAYAWIMLLGWSGQLTRALRAVGIPFGSIVGFHGIVWVALWGSVGLVFLFAHDAFANADPSLEEAAMSVGASRLRTYLQVSLPLARPALLTAAYLVLMSVFTDFGTPQIIGGDVSVLPVLVYHEFLSEVAGNPSMASTGAILMVTLSTAVLMLQRLLVAGRGYSLAGVVRSAPRPLSPRLTALVLAWTTVVFLLAFVPHLAIVFVSFLSWHADIPALPLTLDNYRVLFGRSLSPVVVSYALSLVSTLLAVAAGGVIAYIAVRRSFRLLSPGLSTLAMVPYVIPGTVLAIGLIVVFNRPPLRLTGTAAILVLAYVVRKLPYALKSTEAALHQVHPSLEEAALSLGAPPARVFRDVTLRLVLPAVFSGATLTFLMTLTELSATIMLYGAATTTMSVVILQAAIGMGGQFGLAAATAVAMMVSVYVPLYWLRRRVAALAATGA